MYEIRYKSESWGTASSIADALHILRRKWNVKLISKTVCPDGIYCYADPGDKRDDDTGERADAVICKPDKK